MSVKLEIGVDALRVRVVREAAERERPEKRVKTEAGTPAPPVVLWMSRDQRVDDNWALLHAQAEACSRSAPLCVVFCLIGDAPGSTMRHYGFMIKGMREVEVALSTLNIEFQLLQPAKPSDVVQTLTTFLEDRSAQLLVTDYSPLRAERQWKRAILEATPTIPVHEVDAHNVVPVRSASEKIEYAARTIRPRIERQLGRFLTEFPPVRVHPYPTLPPTDHKAELIALYTAHAPAKLAKVDAVLKKYSGQERAMIDALTAKYLGQRWDQVAAALAVDRTVLEVAWCVPGAAAASDALRRFLANGVARYGKRNDPNCQGECASRIPTFTNYLPVHLAHTNHYLGR